MAFYMQFDIHKNLYFLRICGNFNTSKIAFGSACRALYVAEPRFMSASGRFMHLWCVSCGGAALFCYVVRPRAGVGGTGRS